MKFSLYYKNDESLHIMIYSMLINMEEEMMDIEESPTLPSALPPALGLVGAELEAGGVSHAVKISMAEYNMQAQDYTQQALRELKASPEYKKHSLKCHRYCYISGSLTDNSLPPSPSFSCRCSWYDGEFSAGCAECGGFAVLRPCPVCDGHCASMWQRNVDMVES